MPWWSWKSTNTLAVANVSVVIDPLTAVAEPNRRRILQLLAARARTVSEVAAEFPVTRSAISQHLLVLAEAGLVEAEKVGRERIYRVLPSGLGTLQAEIDKFWTSELELLVTDTNHLRRRSMSVTKTVVLPVTPDEAFALITEPDRLRRWQVVTAVVDLRAGGSYRWTVTPGHVAAGTFREVEPGRRIVFGWGWDGDASLPPDASTVTVTLEPVEGGSLVTLVHEGLDEVQAKAHTEGWNHYVDRLARLATTGDAGPDEWAFAPQDLTPIIAAEAALAVLQPMLRNLTAEDRPKPTPCTDFTCHELAEHLMASLTQLGAMAGVTVLTPATGSLEDKVSVMAGQTIDAWRAVDLAGTVSGPGGTPMQAAFLAGILPLEMALHGWDLAQGSGQQLHISEELVGYLRGLAEQIVPGGRGTSFADEITPSPDASPIDRLAAYAGRTPIAA
jgi:uncharacterized protein (TIGR03086 family)